MQQNRTGALLRMASDLLVVKQCDRLIPSIRLASIRPEMSAAQEVGVIQART